ncbi:MAG: MATE family efflux transporter [Candidatus Eremiobacteraeota bacterium]|nr:MATE family efflux transporter [Candidatus Eremiobacteraeota bacterium]
MASGAATRRGVNIFSEGRPMWQLFLVFLVPLMLSNILQSASQTFSSIFLGRLIGVDALAAVSAIFPLLFLLISFIIGLSSGSTVLIGQAFGAGDYHAMKRVAGTTLTLSVLLGVLSCVIVGAFTYPLLHLVSTPANIIDQSAMYTRIVLVYIPIFFVYIAYTTFLRGTGDSQTPFYFLIISTVLSLVCTPMLIRGWLGLPQMGIAGAAIAGYIANAAAFIGLLVYLNATNHSLRFDNEMLRDMAHPDWKIARTVFRIGIPAGLQTIMVALAEIAVISFVNRYGSDATAAYGAVNQIVGYVQFPAISIGITASIFGAQCIGARREDKLGAVIHSGVALNYIIGGLLVLVCYFGAWGILGWFITDQHTLNIAHALLMITLWSYLIFGNNAVLSGVMRASGTVLWPTAISIFAIWAVEVPSAYILMHRYDIDGIWMGYPIAFLVALGLQFSYYTFVWKKKTHERLI